MNGVGASGPSSRATGVGAACGVPRFSASARGVRSRNTSRGVIRKPCALARLIKAMATMLSPPARKKSVSPSTSDDSVSAKMSTSASNVESVVTTRVSCAVRSVNAFRSSLPLTVSGRASTSSTWLGTMYAGSFADRRPVSGAQPTT